jgi:parallel beta-helix repeat protein
MSAMRDKGLNQSLIAALTIVLLDAGAASAAPPTPVTACNQVLSVPGDYMLASDLTCAGTAVIINGDNVRFNLAGFALSGDTTGSGIEVSFASRVRIRGGTIRRFGNGIRLDTSNTVRVNDMVLVANGDGIQLQSSDDNRMADSRITGNVIGVRLDGSDHNTVSDNTISNNVADPVVSFSGGVLLQNGSTGNVISSNNLASNGGVGVTLRLPTATLSRATRSITPAPAALQRRVLRS